MSISVPIVVRDALMRALIERDGDVCQFPGCKRPFTSGGQHDRTIDHYIPQVYCKAHGWTHEMIWDLSNLRLMGQRCNAAKSDRVPNEDGSLPPRARDLRPDKSSRPPLCETCESGRLLLQDEECDDCGSGPQPSTAPRCHQVSPKDCGHGWGENPQEHCWMCFIGHVPRRASIESVLYADGVE